jgi:hypothetical protein
LVRYLEPFFTGNGGDLRHDDLVDNRRQVTLAEEDVGNALRGQFKLHGHVKTDLKTAARRGKLTISARFISPSFGDSFDIMAGSPFILPP